MKTCSADLVNGEKCPNMVEGRTDMCATHNKLQRDLLKREAKEAEKRAIKMTGPKLKRGRPIKPVSEKRKVLNQEYSVKREQFLLNKWCAYHGHPCIPTQVHHGAGRVGSLFLDERYWVPLCMQAHEWVELNPNEAKDKGLSFSRLAKDEKV